MALAACTHDRPPGVRRCDACRERFNAKAREYIARRRLDPAFREREHAYQAAYQKRAAVKARRRAYNRRYWAARVPACCDGPTRAAPGSAAKIAVLAARYARRRRLFHPDDAKSPVGAEPEYMPRVCTVHLSGRQLARLEATR